MTDNYLGKALELFSALTPSLNLLAQITKHKTDPVTELLDDMTEVLLYLALSDGYLSADELEVLTRLSGIDGETAEGLTKYAEDSGLRRRSADELAHRSVESIDRLQKQAGLDFGYTGDVMPSVILLFELSCLSMLEAIPDGQRQWAEDATLAILDGIRSSL